MKLVIGGAFQGKLSFAKEKFQTKDGWVDGCNCTMEELFACSGVFHFHEYVRRLVKEQQDISAFTEALIRKNPDIIVITNELGYGVVPIKAFDRAYREATGRVCTKLAEYSDEVYRVLCGIGQVIKGD